jgi:hypothetical protein
VSRPRIPASLDRRVRLRAGERCEYCRLAQARQEATFHVDHRTPVREGGPTTQENLALACVSCSLRKGARVDAEDTETGARVPLFDPRTDAWGEHFEVREDATIAGRSASGRATVAALGMNRTLAVAIRFEEMLRGRYPAVAS